MGMDVWASFCTTSLPEYEFQNLFECHDVFESRVLHSSESVSIGELSTGGAGHGESHWAALCGEGDTSSSNLRQNSYLVSQLAL